MTDTKALEEQFAAIAAKLQARQAAQAALEAATTPNTIEPAERIGDQMPLFPEDAAAMPTELSRVALFGLPSDKRGARKMLDDVRLESRADVEVLYTGKQLSAKDETAWLACLRIGRGAPMGQRIYMSKSDLLREVGLARNGQNWQALKARLMRMSKAHFTITCQRGGKKFTLTTGMLKFGFENDDPDGQMYIRLDPDGARLFESLAYQPWEIRLSLKSDISALLLSYVCGHQHGKPHAVALESLKAWCGHEGETRKFRAALRAALAELELKGVLVPGSKIGKGARGEIVAWTRTRAKLAE